MGCDGEFCLDYASEVCLECGDMSLVATADYFSSNRTLMTEGILVDVDISEHCRLSQAITLLAFVFVFA